MSMKPSYDVTTYVHNNIYQWKSNLLRKYGNLFSDSKVVFKHINYKHKFDNAYFINIASLLNLIP